MPRRTDGPSTTCSLSNLRVVLELCAAGEVRCSEKTGRPSAATIRAVSSRLVNGDFYADEPIAAFVWPLCCMRQRCWPPWAELLYSA
jgi:hypothetical protein